MPNSICPRNSIFHRLFLNWGENIPRYFRSCSRVLKAIMLSFPISVPFVVFCAWLFYHIQQLEPIFAYFTSQNSYHPIKQGLSLFLGVKNWGYSNSYKAVSCPAHRTKDERKSLALKINLGEKGETPIYPRLRAGHHSSDCLRQRPSVGGYTS